MSTPKRVPNFHKIENIAALWRRLIISEEEAIRSLKWEMDPRHYIPSEETGPRGLAECDYTRMLAEAIVRIERKLNVVIQESKKPLPDEINPEILCEEVKELVREGNMVSASAVHRKHHNIGLAETVKLLRAYKASLSQDASPPAADTL